MVVRVKWSAFKQSRWYEYVLRFVLGGLATTLAGGVANVFGHERERKQKLGLSGYRRGLDAAALDAAGTGLGSIGLAAFGLGVWVLAPTLAFESLALGAVGWLLASMLLWRLRREARIVK